jgi:hypothetical protein
MHVLSRTSKAEVGNAALSLGERTETPFSCLLKGRNQRRGHGVQRKIWDTARV